MLWDEFIVCLGFILELVGIKFNVQFRRCEVKNFFIG